MGAPEQIHKSSKMAEVIRLYGLEPDSADTRALYLHISPKREERHFFDFTAEENFLNDFIERAKQFDQPIKIILKAAGLDGRSAGFVVAKSESADDAAALPAQEEGEEAQQDAITNIKVEQYIRRYVNASEYAVEPRIEKLLALADKTDAAIKKIAGSKFTKELLATMKLTKRSFDQMTPAQQAPHHKYFLEEMGYDLYGDPVKQYLRAQRLNIWRGGPERVESNIAEVLEINRQENQTFTQRLERKTLQGNSQASKKKKKFRGKPDYLSQDADTGLPPPDAGEKIVYPAPPERQLPTREDLQWLLEEEQAQLSCLQERIREQKEITPVNERHLDEQFQLLAMAGEDIESLRQDVFPLLEEKKATLSAIALLGQDVEEYQTAPGIIEIIETPARPLIPAAGVFGRRTQPAAARNNDDLAAYGGIDDVLLERIVSCRRDVDELSDTHSQMKDKNERLMEWSIQAERDTHRLLKKTARLEEARIDLMADLPQLSYLLEDLKSNAGIAEAFGRAAGYPPLPMLGKWVRDNLDESRIIVLPQAIK